MRVLDWAEDVIKAKAMKVLITGATGLVGSALCQRLAKQSHSLVILSRNSQRAQEILKVKADYMEWGLQFENSPLAHLDAVVHLAGEPIASGRWTESKKKKVRDSRVLGTRRLVDLLVAKLPQQKPFVFISSSAVGFYEASSKTELSEESPAGKDFLSQVCVEWEAEAQRLGDLLSSARIVLLRTGLVLSRDGGAFPKLLKAFRYGLGGRLGDGNQWMSWIHIDDLVSLILFALERSDISGALNATAPGAVSNRDFTNALSQQLGRPAVMHAPAFALKLLFGEMSTVFLSGANVIPQKALRSGFSFRFPELKKCLQNLCL